MWDVLINKIFENYPLIFCFVLGGFLTWLVARFYFRRFCPLEADVRKIGDSFRDLKSSLVKTIRTTIKEYLIDSGLAKFPHDSPIALSEEDHGLIKNAQFDKYAQNNEQLFLEHFQRDRPQNRAEGLKRAVVLLMKMDEEKIIDLNKLKDAGYQAGKTETEIQIIAGIYLWQNIIEPKLYNGNH